MFHTVDFVNQGWDKTSPYNDYFFDDDIIIIMTCHYLEEEGHRKICRARGTLSPTIHELRVYCYRLAYECPHYQKYLAKMTKVSETDETTIKQDHLDEEYRENFEKDLY